MAIFTRETACCFVTQKLDTPFTGTNVYWLTWGGAPGLRMGTTDGTPGSRQRSCILPHHRACRREPLLPALLPQRAASRPLGTGLHLRLGAPASKTYTITLHYVASIPGTAELRGLLKGYAALPSPPHPNIHLNNHLVVDQTWAPQADDAFDVTIPQADLVEGANTIRVECPMDDGISSEALFINWFEVEYSCQYAAGAGQTTFSSDQAGDWLFQVPGFSTNSLSAWDISDPLAPVQIQNPQVTQNGSTDTLAFEQAASGARQYLASDSASLLAPDSLALVNAWLACAHLTTQQITSLFPILASWPPCSRWRTITLPLGCASGLSTSRTCMTSSAVGSFDSQAIDDFRPTLTKIGCGRLPCTSCW